jgi:hypothetical protein
MHIRTSSYPQLSRVNPPAEAGAGCVSRRGLIWPPLRNAKRSLERFFGAAISTSDMI